MILCLLKGYPRVTQISKVSAEDGINGRDSRNRVNTRSLKGSSFLKKVLAYRAISEKGIHTSHLGIPNLLILTVAPTQARIETMEKSIHGVYGTDDGSNFLFRSISTQGHSNQEDSRTSHMFHGPWQRAILDDFGINDQRAR